MRSTRILASYRGNSILTVFVGATILGTIAYYSSQSLLNRAKVAKGIETKNEFSNLVDYINLVLYAPEGCRLNFENKIVDLDNKHFQNNSSFDPKTFDIAIPDLTGAKGKILAKTGDTIGDMKLTELKLKIVGKLGSDLAGDLHFKVERPPSEDRDVTGNTNVDATPKPKPQSRSAGVPEKTAVLHMTLATKPGASSNEAIITDCTTNPSGLVHPTPTPGAAGGVGTWAAIPTGGGARGYHTAVWTGSKMILWGGTSKALNNGSHFQGALDTGAVFDPATNSFAAVSTTGAPAARSHHAAVWTGSRMLVFGGMLASGNATNTGGRFDPATNSWSPMSLTNAPAATSPPHGAYQIAIWANNKLYVPSAGFWHSYDPSSDSWQKLGAGTVGEFAILADTKILSWGGQCDDYFHPGSVYDLSSNTSSPINTYGIWSLCGASAVWSGKEMIVYGGTGYHFGGTVNTAAIYKRYNPATDKWSGEIDRTGGPGRGSFFSVVWTGSQMLVWGGGVETLQPNMMPGGYVPADGAVRFYDPNIDAWTTYGAHNSPRVSPGIRSGHTSIWTGSQLIVFGGFDSVSYGGNPLESGGVYSP